MNRALATLAAAAIVLAAALFALIATSQPVGRSQAPDTLPMPDDIPLMTDQEKEWARESGVGSYRVGDMYYVDWSLPSTYWEE